MTGLALLLLLLLVLVLVLPPLPPPPLLQLFLLLLGVRLWASMRAVSVCVLRGGGEGFNG
jgi:hypothetical protein